MERAIDLSNDAETTRRVPGGARAEIVLGGARPRAPISRLEVHLAADRPDRLDVDLVVTSRDEASLFAALSTPPGVAIRARIGGRPVFSGTTDGWSLRRDAFSGSSIRVLAHAAYQSSRAKSAARRYYQVTSSDVAEAIARELELLAVVERTRTVHARCECAGDPLRFLRELACEEEFELAVVDGTLYFVNELPVAKERMTATAGDLISLQLDRPCSRRADGVMEVRGDPRWRPLVPFGVAPAFASPALDGRLVAWRCVHRLSRDGYVTGIEFRRGLGERTGGAP